MYKDLVHLRYTVETEICAMFISLSPKTSNQDVLGLDANYKITGVPTASFCRLVPVCTICCSVIFCLYTKLPANSISGHSPGRSRSASALYKGKQLLQQTASQVTFLPFMKRESLFSRIIPQPPVQARSGLAPPNLWFEPSSKQLKRTVYPMSWDIGQYCLVIQVPSHNLYSNGFGVSVHTEAKTRTIPGKWSI